MSLLATIGVASVLATVGAALIVDTWSGHPFDLLRGMASERRWRRRRSWREACGGVVVRLGRLMWRSSKGGGSTGEF